MIDNTLNYFDLQRIALRELYSFENKTFCKQVTNMKFPAKFEKYSFMYNAIYKGLYDSEDIYDYKRMMPLIRELKGLGKTVNVVEHMGNVELRLNSLALKQAREEILDFQSNGIMDKQVYVKTIYLLSTKIAETFTLLNKKNMRINYLTNQKGNPRICTLIKRFDRNLKAGKAKNVSSLKPPRVAEHEDYIKSKKLRYGELFEAIKQEFIKAGITDVNLRKDLFNKIDEGFYQTTYLTTKNINIIYDLIKANNNYNSEDLTQHTHKLETAYKQIKASSKKDFQTLKNVCQNAGENARLDILHTRQTLPELSFYFTKALTEIKLHNFENEVKIQQEQNESIEKVQPNESNFSNSLVE